MTVVIIDNKVMSPLCRLKTRLVKVFILMTRVRRTDRLTFDLWKNRTGSDDIMENSVVMMSSEATRCVCICMCVCVQTD